MERNGPGLRYIQKVTDIGCDAHATIKAGAEVSCGAAGLVEMIDTYDREGKAYASGDFYKVADIFADGCVDKPGKRLPKAGMYASAGVGHAGAQWSIFEAEAKGPNVAAAMGATTASLSAKAFVRAELASASASAGPLKAKVGLSAETGIEVGVTGLEAKLLGTGFSIGRKMSVSLFGNSIEVNLW